MHLRKQAKPLREKLAATAGSGQSRRAKRCSKQIKAIEAQRRPLTHGLLMTDSTKNIAATHVLFQGDHKSPRATVEAGFPSVFDPQPATIAKSDNSKTTGRRLTLANWIASPQNPLTARVFVNRIWTSLMGRPLVATPNDFGLAGSRPEDAALLDWLASEFVAARLVGETARAANRNKCNLSASAHVHVGTLRASLAASRERRTTSRLAAYS